MYIKLITLLSALLFSTFTFAGSGSELAGKSWDAVEEQAKQEGSVTFSVWYLQPQWRNFVSDFEKKYGIKVRIPEGTLDGNINKLMAEAGNEQGKMDVLALSVTQLPITRKAGALAPVNWLPGYSDALHQLQSVDTEGYAIAFWGNQTGMAYDPQQIGKQSLPQTLDDLQRFIDKNPGKFGYNDPNNGGAGEAFIQRILTISGGDFNANATQVDTAVIKNWGKGWQWFIRNKGKITQTSSGADSLTRLNDGELLLVPAWQDHLAGLQKSGALTSRLKFYIPKFSMPGGGNIAAIATNSPHPAAAALFLNWLIQPNTQQALHTTFGSIPMNKQINNNIESPEKTSYFYGKEYQKQLKKEFVRYVTMQ